MILLWRGKSMLFLLTPLREGRRLRAANHQHHSEYFYSRPYGRGDALAADQMDSAVQFLLTPLREGRRAAEIPAAARTLISTHAPAGGATCSATVAVAIVLPISTHAPAGGATSSWIICAYRRPISTHAPAGGATDLSILLWRMPVNFYSRPCGRGDQHLCNALINRSLISTHAPAGGATCCGKRHDLRFRQFLLTPLREGRLDKRRFGRRCRLISTHAPAGGATRRGLNPRNVGV